MNALFFATMLFAASSGAVNNGETVVAQDSCEEVKYSVSETNAANFRSLFVNIGFLFGTGVTALGVSSCMWFLGGLPLVTLAGWITLVTLSVVGGVIALMIFFDILKVVTQQSPEAAYSECRLRRGNQTTVAQSMSY